MTFKQFIKAFISGMAFPAVFLPLAYTFLYFTNQRVPTAPIQFIPMYIPLVFGLANAIYVHMREGAPAKSANSGLWVAGGCLGFVVAVLGVFIFKFPTLIFGVMHPDMQYVPLVALPIIYGAIFRYIVKWLNKNLSV